MTACSQCGEQLDMGYSCSYCTGSYCSDHRLPESHSCPGLRRTSPPERDRMDNTIKNTASRDYETADPVTYGSSPDPNYERSPDVAPDGSIATAPSTLSEQSPARSSTSGIRLSRYVIVIGLLTVGIAAGTPYLDAGISTPGFSDLPELPDTDIGEGEPRGVAANTTTTPHTPTPTPVPREEKLEAAIHERINNKRAERGLSKLDYRVRLEKVAELHSKDMAEKGYFSHTSPDGKTMSDRYDEVGYACRVETGENRYLTGAENIFKFEYSGLGYSVSELADRAVEGWMNSKGHRENILTPEWENEGIGVEIVNQNGDTVIYVTQNFC